MRGRLEHTIVLAIAIELSMVIAFGALLLAPRWKLVPFAATATRDVTMFPLAWSPDGGALLTTTMNGIAVLSSDGSVLAGDQLATSSAWVDARTLLLLEKVDDSTVHLVRLDTIDGHRDAIGESLPRGHLIADGRGRVAYQSDVGPPTMTVIDPTDGRSLAKLEGYGARAWTDDGALIVKRLEASLDAFYIDPGSLFLWRPGETPRALAPNLVDLGYAAPLSPAGDAIACVCGVAPPASDGRAPDPPRALHRVPLDGSSPTMLAPWPSRPGSDPEIAWIDSTSLAIVEEGGLSRVSLDGGRRAIPGLAAADLGFTTMIGRVFVIRGGAVAVVQDLLGGAESVLVVIEDQDRIRMRRSFTGNLPTITIDVAGERGVVLTEFTIPGEPAFWDLFMLEFR